LSKPDKPIAILRLTGGDKDKGLYNAFRQSSAPFFLTNNKICCVYIDSSNKFDWMDQYKTLLAYYKTHEVRTLLVINQTCTRSTELGFHKYLAFLHDHRPNESNYSTLAQAYLRVAHYHPEGHQIYVYAQKEIFELAAGLITKEEFSGKLSSRMNKQTMKIGEVLSKDPIHWYKPEDDYITDLDIINDPIKLKQEIHKIWNSHIVKAKKPGAFKSGNVYKGHSEAKVELSLNENGQMKEITERDRGMDNISTTKRHYFHYQNVDARDGLLGGGEKSTMTRKRHELENISDDTSIKVRVYSIFHDGTMEKIKKEETTHITSDKSVYGQKQINDLLLEE